MDLSIIGRTLYQLSYATGMALKRDPRRGDTEGSGPAKHRILWRPASVTSKRPAEVVPAAFALWWTRLAALPAPPRQIPEWSPGALVALFALSYRPEFTGGAARSAAVVF